MVPQPPPGQEPVDPRGAFSPPPPPSGSGTSGGLGNEGMRPSGPMPGAPGMGMMPPGSMPPGGMPPPGFGPPLPPMPPPGWMPPMYPPPPPPKRGGGFARGILITLATTIFGISLTLNIYLLLFSGLMGGSSGSLETSLTSGAPDQKIAVIPVEGLIDVNTSMQVNPPS